MNTAPSNRNNELAMIHIATKDLGMEVTRKDLGPGRDEYRDLLFAIARVRSSADLDQAGRAAVLRHFKNSGWKPKPHPGKSRQRRSGGGSGDRVSLILRIWARLHEEGVVRSGSDLALREWVQNTTRRYHPEGTGYSALEFLPDQVASKVIEHLKKWAARCKVRL